MHLTPLLTSPFMIHAERVKWGGSLSSFRTHGHGQGVHEVMVENVFLYGKSQNIENCYSIVLWLTGRGRLPSSPPLLWAGQAPYHLSVSHCLFLSPAGAGAGAGPVFAPRLLPRPVISHKPTVKN